MHPCINEEMVTPTNDSGGVDRKRLMALVEECNRLHSSSASADHRKRSEMLDELQEAVGLSGRTVTEQDILRQVNKLLSGK